MGNRIGINELEYFVKTENFSDEPLVIDQCTTVTNRRKFAESHLATLKAGTGNKLFMPYYIRLVKFYNLIQDEKNKRNTS